MRGKTGFCWKRFWLMLVGNICIGISVAFARFSGYGVDPFSCMNLGISSHLPISYGTYQFLVQLVLFIPVIWLYPKSFGIGAFFNMLGVGYVSDFCVWLLGLFHVTIESVADETLIRILCIPGCVLFLCFGVALYMECSLGASPYDMLGQIIEDRSHGKIPFRIGRIIVDCISIVIGYIAGGTVGIITVITGFCTGPIVSFFRKRVAPFLQVKKEATQAGEK